MIFARSYAEVARHTAKPFCAGEADSVFFKTIAVQQMNSSYACHAGELILMPALMVMIAKDSDDRDANAFQNGQAGLHLLWQPVIGQVASQHQHVGGIIHCQELADVFFLLLSPEMHICYCCQSHPRLLSFGSTACRSTACNRDG